MIQCEGGCKDWYHCECMNMTEDDAKELLDRFICPNCQTDKMFTTYKRLCRYDNVPGQTCRKAALVSNNPPSKYCSPEHGRAFMAYLVSQLRPENEPYVPGGRISVGELKSLLKAAPTIEEFHALGKKPRLPVKEGADPSKP